MHRSHVASLAALSQAAGTWAATVTYNWNATWVWAAPDGFYRPVIGINNQWPCPLMEANVNDTIVVNLNNQLGNETAGLHFHGIDQINSNYMDGPTGVTQCPLAPGGSLTYSFLANAPGSFWYHSHNMGQYPDGLRGPFVVHDPNDPYLDLYDEDVILTVSDWYHEQSPELSRAMLQPNNTKFLPPRPQSPIINEGSDGQISVEAGKTYRIRIMSFAALTSAFIEFEGYEMNIIMMDASYIQNQTAQQIRVSAAQRYDVLITVSDNSTLNTPYLVALDTNEDYTAANPAPAYHTNFTGQLVADASTAGSPPGMMVQAFNPFDDTTARPLDNQAPFGNVTSTWTLNFDYCRDEHNYPRACFNNVTYIAQEVPTLYSAVSLGTPNNTEASAYGQTNSFVVGYGETLEIVLNNHDAAIHPFHLHGHQFQVIERPGSGAGDFDGTYTYDGTGDASTPPPRRDVISVFANSHTVLRLVASNPGVYLFHCHIEWHVEMGLVATLIEAPEVLAGYTIPQDFLDACYALDVPTTGNAAGNQLWSDDVGFVTVPPTSYYG
ncbi:Cupredoxin [Xylariaceae sp. FL0804]|nr:Cupredoxin [Xylariaceae sp. FL0804]